MAVDSALKDEETRKLHDLMVEERERAEDAVRVSEARWRTLLENSTVGIALTDMEGRFEITNGVYQELLGYSEEEMLQITFLEVTAPQFREINWKLVGECLEGKRQQFDIEKQYRRKDGTFVWVRNNVLLVPGADGKPRHIMAVVDNISARKRAEESLRASEERWRSVFDNTAVGIAVVDAAENYVATNPAYQKMLGYSEKELQELSYEDVTHEEDVETSRTQFRQLVEEKYQQLHVEKRCRRKDGTVVWAKSGVSRVFGAEGRTGLFAAVVADITERKRAEEALRESEEQTRLIVDTALDAVVTMDADGLVKRWAARAERMFGWTAKEAMNSRMSELIIPPQYREAHEFGLRKFLVTGEGALLNRTVEVTALRREGQEFPVELSLAPAKLGGGWIFNAFIRDVSERKRAEQALQEARAELAHVTRLTTMGELAASIAHEINQPLAAIVANGEACLRWLKADPANVDEARESARKIIRDGSRAGEVIKGVRGLARKSAPQLAPLSVNELIEEVIALTHGEIQRNRVLLKTELTPDLPAVLGDRVQLEQVVLNLVLNGMESMAEVAPEQRSLVVGSGRSDANGVVAYLRDCGTGISAEAMQSIFKPFFTTKPGGTGMGLSISRSIVEAHGGRLWAAPNDDRGMTFSFSIPGVVR